MTPAACQPRGGTLFGGDGSGDCAAEHATFRRLGSQDATHLGRCRLSQRPWLSPSEGRRGANATPSPVGSRAPTGAQGPPIASAVAVNVAVKRPMAPVGRSRRAPCTRGKLEGRVGFEPTTRGLKVSPESVNSVLRGQALSIPRVALIHRLHRVGSPCTAVAVNVAVNTGVMLVRSGEIRRTRWASGETHIGRARRLSGGSHMLPAKTTWPRLAPAVTAG